MGAGERRRHLYVDRVMPSVLRMVVVTLVALLLILLPASGVSAQTRTFLDHACGTSVSVSSTSPMRFLKNVVAGAELVVRARIGRATSHLTSDGQGILTTYELVTPRVLFASQSVVLDASKPLTIERPGGTIFKDGDPGCPLSQFNSDLPVLTPGLDAVLLLEEMNGLLLARHPSGVLEIRDSAMVIPREGISDGAQFRGMPVDRFIAHVLALKDGR